MLWHELNKINKMTSVGHSHENMNSNYKARFPLPELTARPVNSASGNRAPVNTARVDG